MKEVLVTVAALVLSFLVAVWTGDGTFFVGVVIFSVLTAIATIAENRHNRT